MPEELLNKVTAVCFCAYKILGLMRLAFEIPGLFPATKIVAKYTPPNEFGGDTLLVIVGDKEWFNQPVDWYEGAGTVAKD